MNRGLALFCIGLVFGGAAGFLVAAANGITLDGHDHAAGIGHQTHDTGMPAGAGMQGRRHDHGEAISLDKSPDAPTLALSVAPDPASGWNLHVVTTGFQFAPEHANGPHRAGEGHAHIHINGKKLSRLYGSWFHIAELPKGQNRIEVTLTANDHRGLAIGGKPLTAEVLLDVN